MKETNAGEDSSFTKLPLKGMETDGSRHHCVCVHLLDESFIRLRFSVDELRFMTVRSFLDHALAHLGVSVKMRKFYSLYKWYTPISPSATANPLDNPFSSSLKITSISKNSLLASFDPLQLQKDEIRSITKH